MVDGYYFTNYAAFTIATHQMQVFQLFTDDFFFRLYKKHDEWLYLLLKITVG
jgi:hypothetical protein